MKSVSSAISMSLLTGAAAGLVILFFFFWPDNNGARVRIGNQIFKVELADTDEKRILGLAKRDSLCRSCGMLFVFSQPGTYAFWMKNMRFPLDIIWIREGRIVHIAKNIHPDSQDVLVPQEAADQVLEINAGLPDAYRIEVGGKAEIIRPM